MKKVEQEIVENTKHIIDIVEGKSKKLPLKDFVEFGYLQEVNRHFFHPLGLAMEVHIDSAGFYTFGGIRDVREDEDGMFFDFANMEEDELVEHNRKADNVQSEFASRVSNRMKLFGSVIEEICTTVKE